MFKTRHWLCIICAAFMLFAVAFATVVVTLPKNFGNTMDTAVSATGLALSRAYYDSDLAPIMDQPGFIYNGARQIYANWPTIGFKTMAIWYQWLGGDSIYNARLLSALMYAISTVLLFSLLLRCHVDLPIAIISTLLFVALPYRLEFGKLIFADIWLLPFWLVCFLLYTGRRNHHWLIVPVAIVGALAFMWFVIFALLALCFIYCCRRFALSLMNAIAFATALLLAAYALQYVLITGFPETVLFWKLDRWSVFSLLGNVDMTVKQIAQTGLRLAYESFAIILLTGFALHKQGAALWQKMFADVKKSNVLSITMLTLLGALLLLPAWFLTHSSGTAFFSVLIAMTGAFVLQESDQLEYKTRLYLGSAAVIITVSLGALLPHLNNDNTAVSEKLHRISEYLDQTGRHESSQPNIFLHFNKRSNWANSLSITMGVKEATRGYMFANSEIRTLSDGVRFFQTNNFRLKKHRKNFDAGYLYFLTDQGDMATQQVGLNVLNVFQVQDWYLYSIKL